MHVHSLWDNESECSKQCYQIEDNNSFKILDILINILQFISNNKSFKKILKENEKENSFCKGFFRKNKFSTKFQMNFVQRIAPPRQLGWLRMKEEILDYFNIQCLPAGRGYCQSCKKIIKSIT